MRTHARPVVGNRKAGSSGLLATKASSLALPVFSVLLTMTVQSLSNVLPLGFESEMKKYE